MKKRNQIVSSILALAMLFSLSSNAFAKEAVTQSDHGVETIAIENDYGSMQVAWDSHFFTAKSNVYNAELAQTALLLSDAAYQENQIKDVEEKLGFTYQTYGYNTIPRLQDNQSAYTIGHQKIVVDEKEMYLINITIRGTVGLEWASNFRLTNASKQLANQSEHYGFSQASKQIIKDAQAYKKAHKELQGKENCLLITGHSRGAAIANLVAKEMTDKQTIARKDRIYAYTFASPNVSNNAKSNQYNHIFNVVNEEDIVTQVPLRAWNFGRYGQDIVTPQASTDKAYAQKYAQMQKNYKQLTAQTYTGNAQTNNKTKLLLDMTNKELPTMQGYTENVFIDGQTLQSFSENMYAMLMAGEVDLSISSLITLKKYAGLLKEPLFISWTQYLMGDNFLKGQIDTSNTVSHQTATYYSWLQVMKTTK